MQHPFSAESGSKRTYFFWEVKDSAEGFYKYYHASSTNLTAFNQLNPYICLGYHWLPEWFLYSWYPLDISAFARPLQRRVSTLRTTLTARQGARANKVLNKVVKSGQVMSSGNFLQNRGFSESQIAAGLLVDDRASRAEQEGRCSFRNLCCEWAVPWSSQA